MLAESSFDSYTIKKEGALFVDYQVAFTNNVDGGNLVAKRSLINEGLETEWLDDVRLGLWVWNCYR